VITEEIQGHIGDVLALNGIGTSRMIEIIWSRVNGVTPEKLLAAAVAVLREQQQRIVDLEAEVDWLGEDNNRLDDEADELKEELKDLRVQLKKQSLPHCTANTIRSSSP
jgi:hypothetical protein